MDRVEEASPKDIKTKYITNYLSIILNKRYEDISIEDLKKVRMLSLSNTDINGEYQKTYVSDLKNLPNIEELDLSNITITDEVLKYILILEKVKKIHFYNCEFLSLFADISGMNYIEELSFYTTIPKDIFSIRTMKLLKSLKLINLKLTDIGFLKEIISLAELDLSNSRILDINIGDILSRVKVLKICNTNIKKIEFLKKFEHLKKIYIDKMQYSNNPETIKYLKENGINIFDENDYLYE